jgi:hypothetical protein
MAKKRKSKSKKKGQSGGQGNRSQADQLQHQQQQKQQQQQQQNDNTSTDTPAFGILAVSASSSFSFSSADAIIEELEELEEPPPVSSWSEDDLQVQAEEQAQEQRPSPPESTLPLLDNELPLPPLLSSWPDHDHDEYPHEEDEQEDEQEDEESVGPEVVTPELQEFIKDVERSYDDAYADLQIMVATADDDGRNNTIPTTCSPDSEKKKKQCISSKRREAYSELLDLASSASLDLMQSKKYDGTSPSQPPQNQTVTTTGGETKTNTSRSISQQELEDRENVLVLQDTRSQAVPATEIQEEDSEAAQQSSSVEIDRMESFQKKKRQSNNNNDMHTIEERDHERNKKAVIWIMISSLLVVVGIIIGAVVRTQHNRGDDDSLEGDITRPLRPLLGTQKELLKYLSQYSPVIQGIIQNDDDDDDDESIAVQSPQYQAFLWLLDGTYDTIYDYQTDDVDKYIVLSSFALATLYYATTGDRWTQEAKTNWLEYDVPVCDWAGINCTTVTSSGGGSVVSTINKQGSKLRGNLTSLHELSIFHNDLQTLDMSYNELLGTVWWNDYEVENDNDGSPLFPKLRVLNLAHNQLNETLSFLAISPRTLSKELKVLNLARNDLIVTDFNNAEEWLSFENIQEIRLDGNRIRSGLPTAPINLPSLEVLSIADAELTGEIPTEFLPGLTNLVYLDLSGNSNMTGSVPHGLFFVLPYLQYLDISGLGLEGMLPTIVSPSLSYLDVSSNNIMLPDTVSFLWWPLETLILNDMPLLETFPVQLASPLLRYV